jgi:hypothetical protein
VDLPTLGRPTMATRGGFNLLLVSANTAPRPNQILRLPERQLLTDNCRSQLL